MAASFVIATTERTALATTLNTDIGSGYLKVYTGTSPGPNSGATGTLLTTFDLPSAASNTVSSGVITLAAISNSTAVGQGTAGYFRILKSDNSTVVADGDVNTAGATFNLNSLSITTSQTVSITAASITVPAGT